MHRTLLRLTLTAVLLLCSPLAQAQDGGFPDGGLADGGSDAGGPVDTGDGGSQGEGGSDRDNPEGEDRTGRVVTSCSSSGACTRGFSCQDGQCVWTGYREATGGFCGAVSALLLVGGVFGFGRRRWRPRAR